MKVRKVRLNKEIFYPDGGGEVVKCPICHAAWWDGDQHVIDSGCPHLRFVYCTYADPGFVGFAGKWGTAAFQKQFFKLARTEDVINEMAAFKKLTDPNVDEVVYEIFDAAPMLKFLTYWGYKTEERAPRTKVSRVRIKT